ARAEGAALEGDALFDDLELAHTVRLDCDGVAAVPIAACLRVALGPNQQPTTVALYRRPLKGRCFKLRASVEPSRSQMILPFLPVNDAGLRLPAIDHRRDAHTSIVAVHVECGDVRGR